MSNMSSITPPFWPPRGRRRRVAYLATRILLRSLIWGTVALSLGCASPPEPVDTRALSSAEVSALEARGAFAFPGRPKNVESEAYGDLVLRYVTLYHRGEGDVLGAPGGIPVKSLLDATSIGLLAGRSAITLDPPWMALMNLGVSTSGDYARGAFAESHRRLSRPSLSLIGTAPGGGPVKSDAFDATLNRLFDPAVALVESSPMGCENALHTHARRRGDRIEDRTNALYLRGALRERSFLCQPPVPGRGTSGRDIYDAEILVTAVPRERAGLAAQSGMVPLRGAPAAPGDAFVRVSWWNLDRYPHLGGADAGWALLGALAPRIPEGWTFVLSDGRGAVAAGSLRGGAMNARVYPLPAGS